MKYALIINGVVNALALQQPLIDGEPDKNYIECADDVFAGHTYADGVFTAPPAPDPAPITVTPYQAREALRLAGQLATVEALVEQQGGQIYNAWHYAPYFRDDHDLILTLSAALGWSAEQRRELFVSAKGIIL